MALEKTNLIEAEADLGGRAYALPPSGIRPPDDPKGLLFVLF